MKTIDQVRAVLSDELNIDFDNVTQDTKISEIVDDSLDMFQILVALEDEFGIEIEIDQQFVYVHELITYIENTTNQQ